MPLQHCGLNPTSYYINHVQSECSHQSRQYPALPVIFNYYLEPVLIPSTAGRLTFSHRKFADTACSCYLWHHAPRDQSPGLGWKPESGDSFLLLDANLPR